MDMKIFWADVVSPEEHSAKEVRSFQRKEEEAPSTTTPNTSKRKRRGYGSILAEQVINALIVGGIAGLSSLGANVETSWKAGAIAFGLTFLIEMRKYRKL